LLSLIAWISSTMTYFTVPSAFRNLSVARMMNSDSGVVMKICGGFRAIAARSFVVVSPVRTAERTSGISIRRLFASFLIPASGSTRFFWMSLLSAFRGEM